MCMYRSAARLDCKGTADCSGESVLADICICMVKVTSCMKCVQYSYSNVLGGAIDEPHIIAAAVITGSQLLVRTMQP